MTTMKLANELDSLRQDSFMLGDPVAYNSAVVGYFRTKYSREIDLVFEGLESEARSGTSPWLHGTLTSVRNEILERHLFPVFATTSLSNAVSPDHLRFAIAFAKSISIPVMRTDRRLDAPPWSMVGANNYSQFTISDRIEQSCLSELCLIYSGTKDVLDLPHGSEIVGLLVRNYQKIYCSLYTELAGRYELAPLRYPLRVLRNQFSSPISSLTCKYFSTTVQASFLLNGGQLTDEVTSISDSFGVFRQLCDQISDLNEDTCLGIASVPLLFALLRGPDALYPAISALWSEINLFSGSVDLDRYAKEVDVIFHLVEDLNGFASTYHLADVRYRQTIRTIAEFMGERGAEIELLFRLKRAYLERIRSNNWCDVPGVY